MELVALPVIALLAFTLKAMTGFGPAIVVISLGSLVVPPQAIIATSSVLDFIAGAALLRGDYPARRERFWVPLACLITSGSIIGALFLDSIPRETFGQVLATAVLLLGFWFGFARPRGKAERLRESLPEQSSSADKYFTFAGGLLGGLLGISGPPIVWHFGRQYAKRAFRQVLVPVFVVAAMIRTIMYSALGMVDQEVLLYIAISLPGLVVGLYVGNKIFLRISEKTFSRIVGLTLVLVGIKLFW